MMDPAFTLKGLPVEKSLRPPSSRLEMKRGLVLGPGGHQVLQEGQDLPIEDEVLDDLGGERGERTSCTGMTL